MKWEVGSAQSQGSRSNQEDAYCVLRGRDGAPVILAVADGAGGHAGGERASRTAISSIERAFSSGPAAATDGHGWLENALAEAGRGVSELGSGKAAPRTTVVVAWIAGHKAVIAHVGDSRCYHFRDGKLAFRTSDHSVVQMLLDIGRLTEAELHTHPDRSRLLKALGGGEGAAPDITELSLARGDALALCSDGVWEHVEPTEMAAALRAPELEPAAMALVSLAVSRGGNGADNATIILARAS